MTFLKNTLTLLFGSVLAITTNAQNPSSPFQAVRLNDGNPIISSDMFVGNPTEGDNINGPSMIRVPDWIEPGDRADPSAQYYLYFGNHDGAYIRMAWAADIEGPYTLYNDFGTPGDRGVLDNVSIVNGEPNNGDILLDNGIRIENNHLASPDVVVDNVNERIILYFHSGSSYFVDGEEVDDQVSWVSTSPNGLEFYDNIEPVHLGSSYFKVFEHDNLLHAFSNGAILNRARSISEPWAPLANQDFTEQLWERHPVHIFNEAIEEPSGELRIRHTGVHVSGDSLQVFYSRRGEFQERIQLSIIDLSVSDWEDWEITPTNADGFLDPIEILTPNPGWEGGQHLLANSEASDAVDVNQLRDPDVFLDTDGLLYLIYTGNGEDALGIARLDTAPTTDASITAIEDAYIRETSSNNFGDLENLRISAGENPDDNRTIYMKFDLTNITQISQAIVRVYANTAETGGAPVTIYETTSDWDQDSLTSENAPALGDLITTTYISDEAEFYDWNITEYAQANIGQEISVAFDIAPSNDVQHRFGSIEEGLNPGQLLLNTSDIILNTQENILENNLSLYPNPARGQIQLNYSGAQALNNLVITDVLGKRVQEMSLNDFNGTQTIDVSKLQSGLYFFSVTSEQNTSTMRVIIK